MPWGYHTIWAERLMLLLETGPNPSDRPIHQRDERADGYGRDAGDESHVEAPPQLQSLRRPSRSIPRWPSWSLLVDMRRLRIPQGFTSREDTAWVRQPRRSRSCGTNADWLIGLDPERVGNPVTMLAGVAIGGRKRPAPLQPKLKVVFERVADRAVTLERGSAGLVDGV